MDRMRLVLLLAALTAALGLAVLTTQTPRPQPANAPAAAFSAERAMQDVRLMARAPRPVGSTDHALVQAYLYGRMAELGLSPRFQAGALSCLLYTSPSPRDRQKSRMPSSA